MANNGKWLEKRVQDALKELQCRRPSFFHRFPDTHSAGNWIPTQPGDYLWLLPQVPALLLEVKSSDKSAPIRSLLDPDQCGKHRLWHRSGHLSAFVYGDSATRKLCWFEGKSVIERSSRLLLLWEGTIDQAKDMLEHVSGLLVNTHGGCDEQQQQ